MAFDKIFEGPPTTGAPNIASLGVDTTNRQLYIGGGNIVGWQPIVAAITSNTQIQEVLSGTKDGTNKTFTSSESVNTGLPYQLFYNGQALFPGVDFDFTVSGDSWTFVTIAPISTDSVWAVYWY